MCTDSNIYSSYSLIVKALRDKIRVKKKRGHILNLEQKNGNTMFIWFGLVLLNKGLGFYYICNNEIINDDN